MEDKKITSPQTGSKKGENKGKGGELPPIVREIPDPPVPNRAHTEM